MSCKHPSILFKTTMSTPRFVCLTCTDTVCKGNHPPLNYIATDIPNIYKISQHTCESCKAICQEQQLIPCQKCGKEICPECGLAVSSWLLCSSCYDKEKANFQTLVSMAANILDKLVDAWDESFVGTYPSYLPSFDEFVADFRSIAKQ